MVTETWQRGYDQRATPDNRVKSMASVERATLSHLSLAMCYQRFSHKWQNAGIQLFGTFMHKFILRVFAEGCRILMIITQDKIS